MNGQKLIKPQVSTDGSLLGKAMEASKYPTISIPANIPKSTPQDLKAMELQDPQIQPVYSVSPAVAKSGLAAALAMLGLGI